MFYVVAEMEIPPTLAVRRYRPDFKGLSLTECYYSEGEEEKDLWLKSKHRKYAGLMSEEELLTLADDWQLLADHAQEMLGIVCEYGTLPGMFVPGEILETYLDYPQYFDESLTSGPWSLNPGCMPSLNVSFAPADGTTWQDLLDVLEKMK